MKKVLVTGSGGFIGKNLLVALKRRDELEIETFDKEDGLDDLERHLKDVDMVFHLAGVNRPETIKEFEIINVGLTRTLLDILDRSGKSIPIVFSSSIQAGLNNPYGKSKKQAEALLIEYSRNKNVRVFIYRFPNVFGKWCRPNYNSVVATFCYNISHDLEISISDVDKELVLVYVDDIVDEFMKVISNYDKNNEKYFCEIGPTYKITLGDLADKIYRLKDIRKTLVVPDMSDDFMRCLHATYLSYLDENDFSYKPDRKTDGRGTLAELIKSKQFGQIFISRSHKGIIRGDHYHNTKVEKFCVLEGKAVIKFRHIVKDEVLSYYVSGDDLEVVDIPPGYIHSIENLGDEEMIVLFWANQIFDPEKPDTYHCKV